MRVQHAIYFCNFTKNFLNDLQLKKLWWILSNPKVDVKYEFFIYQNNKIGFSYINYPFIAWWVINEIFSSKKILGVGAHTYFQTEISKWLRVTQKNPYLIKLLSWKDSWYFYGICISWKNNFFSSTIKLRNVFYWEIIEKTYFLFNNRNSLLNFVPISYAQQISLKTNWKKWSKVFFLWTLPWAKSVIQLKQTIFDTLH